MINIKVAQKAVISTDMADVDLPEDCKSVTINNINPDNVIGLTFVEAEDAEIWNTSIGIEDAYLKLFKSDMWEDVELVNAADSIENADHLLLAELVKRLRDVATVEKSLNAYRINVESVRFSELSNPVEVDKFRNKGYYVK